MQEILKQFPVGTFEACKTIDGGWMVICVIGQQWLFVGRERSKKKAAEIAHALNALRKQILNNAVIAQLAEQRFCKP